VILVVLLTAASACARRTPVISCESEAFGMCHEWLDRSPIDVAEIREAVCHKPDERFAEHACRRDEVFGICEITKSRERSITYQRRLPADLDPTPACRSTGGTWTPVP